MKMKYKEKVDKMKTKRRKTKRERIIKQGKQKGKK